MSKNFGESDRDVKKLGEILSKTVKTVKKKARESNGIRKFWTVMVSQDISEHTEVGRIKGDILYVKVDSATWLHYIAAFKKKELLKSIQDGYKRKFISDIRFFV
ncbi:MAG: DUF721 domain-containing protein [Candidatus Scalinduaceae bacterium]